MRAATKRRQESRAAIRGTCRNRRGAALSALNRQIDDVLAGVATVREEQAAERLARPARRDSRTTKERREESDDAVRRNIPAEWLPLWEQVRGSIHGTARKSRTEAFLQYVEEHPAEVHEATGEVTEGDFKRAEEAYYAGRQGNPPGKTNMTKKKIRAGGAAGAGERATIRELALARARELRADGIYTTGESELADILSGLAFDEIYYEESTASAGALIDQATETIARRVRAKKRSKNAPGVSRSTKRGIGIVLGIAAVAGLGYVIFRPSDAHAAVLSTTGLPGLGAPLFSPGDTVIVAGDTLDPISAASFAAIVAALQVQAPDLRFVPVPLVTAAGFPDEIDQTPLAVAVNAAPMGAKGEGPGAILLWTAAAAGKVGQPETFGHVKYVEVAEGDGGHLTPTEEEFIRRNRTSISRLFGYNAAAGRSNPTQLAAEILSAARNPSGMPAERSV